MSELRDYLFYEEPGITLYCGDALTILRELVAESIQCVVTSPPYWGLRDYGLEPLVWDDPGGCEHGWGDELEHGRRGNRGISGTGGNLHPTLDKAGQGAGAGTSGAFCHCRAWRGSLGLEPTPDLYAKHLIDIFREVKRVLRDDGTVFLNLGDSYFASDGAHKPEHANPGLSKSSLRGGVPHGRPYGTSGKEPQDSIRYDCPSTHLCDGCLGAFSSGTVRTGILPAAELDAGSLCPNPAHTGFEPDPPPTSHSAPQRPPRQSFDAIQDRQHSADLAGKQPGASQESTHSESFRLHPAWCYHCANCGVCLSVSRSSMRDARLCARRSGHTDDSKRSPGLSDDRQDSEPLRGAYPYYTTAYLKPKDLIGIPWRVAFALQADGWYLRSDVIWSKPNPMPESVTDRPTKSHEYLFLLSKSAAYYYDAEAIKEPSQSGPSDIRKMVEGYARFGGKHKNLDDPMNKASAATAIGRRAGVGSPDGRNRRTVWTIATEPYRGAHFATFPDDLVKPCVLAGSPSEGIVLDPFAGAGTTIYVAKEFGRAAIGIDLNSAYLTMAVKRLRQEVIRLSNNSDG